MRRPTAIPMPESGAAPAAGARPPRAFAPSDVAPVTPQVESYSEPPPAEAALPPPPRPRWLVRMLWTTAGLLVSLALGLALDALLANLFAASPWLGWAGLAVLALFLLAALALLVRELAALWRLRALDRLRARAAAILLDDNLDAAAAVLAELAALYAPRPDLARALARLEAGRPQLFDGAELLRFAERTLMAPLDARARALTALSARRVALVTAVSPRALVDIAYVVWESVRLGGAIARLYGARPGLWGAWRLLSAILGHLAVTGGLVLTDGVVEQLVGQGLAARLSQRLGEGVVNGLMTVRVGIAAMRVVRPLAFTTEPAPAVRDFLSDLAGALRPGETA